MQAHLFGTLDSEGHTYTPYPDDAIFGNPAVFLEVEDVRNPSIPRGHDSSAIPELARAAYVPAPTQFRQGSTTSDFNNHRGKYEQHAQQQYILAAVFIGVLAFAVFYKA